ncbi:hypothetical protein GA0070618_5577 [Micromonospora echinospora]|uniref:Uncharacterized protein n=1 Tax=Micromonospora echinospora TaxID=1877 RepID=A0A1C4ZPR6_MICEC|nr:hypothetical protein [Micromonospora echinospora]SCF34978.1 hypothetical protein GA0070618_5577 [Micromonospora echinospora]
MRRSEPALADGQPTAAEDDGHEGPLAEFSALRLEIQERVKAQQQMLSLQLTVSAAIFGFAISRPGMTALLLIMPFTSYLLCGRLVAQHFGTLRVAEYITAELSGRVPGGLGWEEWLRRRQPSNPHLLGSTLPLLLTFVATSVFALGWTVGYVFLRGDVDIAPRIGLAAVWTLGMAATVLSTMLVLQMAGRVPVRSWDETGLS